jgi:acetyltransferase-like isoleucine patch superfamily enzyme
MKMINRLARNALLNIQSQFSRMGYRHVEIGSGTIVGRGAVIRDNVTIGQDCYIGDLSVFEGQTTVGDKTCINAQCHITRFSRIGSHVFIAPFFLSTNDDRMTYHRRDHGKNLVGVTIGDCVRIAGHVMTLPGVKIGEGAVVGAYSLVTKDVEPYTLVYGIPAKVHKDGHGLLEEKILPRFK